jgi:hypothetical protein
MPETLAAIDELIEEMDPIGRKRPANRFWGQGALTRAGLVEELVRRELAHRHRSRSASEKKKRIKAPPASCPPKIAAGELPAEDDQVEQAIELADWNATVAAMYDPIGEMNSQNGAS